LPIVSPDGFRFYQQSPAGAWMLAAPVYNAAAWSPNGTISGSPIPQSSSSKKVVRHCKFSEMFGSWRNITYQMMQLKMHRF
jgi:hypothetical protein